MALRAVASSTGSGGGPITASSITNTGLTAGRVVVSTTGGLETDYANLTYSDTGSPSSGPLLQISSGASGSNRGANMLFLPGDGTVSGSSAHPAIAIGGNDTGFYSSGLSGNLIVTVGGAAQMEWSGTTVYAGNATDGVSAFGTSGARWKQLFLGGSPAITANAPALDIAQTWNNAAVTFSAFQINATNTASAAGSLLFDAQVGGVSMLAFKPSNGYLSFSSTGNAGFGGVTATTGFDIAINGTTPQIRWGSTQGQMLSTYSIGWSASGPGFSNTANISYLGAASLAIGNGTAGDFSGTLKLTKLNPDFTNTATVGSVTINKACGQVILGAAGSSLTLTNSLISTTSQIFVDFAGAPGNAVGLACYAVAGTGSCTINVVPAVTNQTKINFVVFN